MINLNNNNIVSQKEFTPQKTRVKPKKNSVEKMNNANSRAAGGMLLQGNNNEKISFTDDI